MRANDVERIANAVAGTLAGSDPGLLGCGGASDPNEYVCTGEGGYLCSVGAYGCGGAAAFGCPGVFECIDGFLCTDPTGGLFQCPQAFSCPPDFSFMANG